jgi:surface antigen
LTESAPLPSRRALREQRAAEASGTTVGTGSTPTEADAAQPSATDGAPAAVAVTPSAAEDAVAEDSVAPDPDAVTGDSAAGDSAADYSAADYSAADHSAAADSATADSTAAESTAEMSSVASVAVISSVVVPSAATHPVPLAPRRLRALPAAAIAAPPTAPPAGRPARGKRRNPFTVAITLIAIPGIFLTTALPAYAFAPNGVAGQSESASHAYSTAEAQGVTVAASAAGIAIARDSFTATSPEELAQRAKETARAAAAEKAAETARASAAEWAVYGVRAEGDDYPWPYQATDSQGGGLSPLGYYYRECVDFVAWRLNRDGGSSSAPWRWTWNSLTPGGGNASSWASAWKSHGWATSTTPVVGAVAWFNYNHVAYVQSVPGDGTVVLEEYNWVGSHAYHKRTVSTGEVPLFLYPPA